MATLSQDIISKVDSAFGFEVDRLPLAGPDGLRTPFYGLFRSDTGELASRQAVTKKYVPHTSRDVKALVSACAESLGGVSNVRCGFRFGHYVAVEPSKEHRRAVFGTNDNIFPRMVIRAGYGGQSFRASLGTYRDVCSNMSIIRRVAGVSQTIRHISGLEDAMAELVQTFSAIAARWDSIAEVVAEMEARKVRLADFLKTIYGEPKEDSRRSLTMHRNRTESIMRRVMRERMATGRPDLDSEFIVSGWEAYNAVQGYVQHDARRKGKQDDMGRIIAAMNDAAVRRAESLVFDLAM